MGQSPNPSFDPFAPDPWNVAGPVPMRPLTDEERANIIAGYAAESVPAGLTDEQLDAWAEHQAAQPDPAALVGGTDGPLTPFGQDLFNELTHKQIGLLMATIERQRTRIEALEAKSIEQDRRLDLLESHAHAYGVAVLAVRARVARLAPK